jgi:ribosome-interacting GTPase 1
VYKIPFFLFFRKEDLCVQIIGKGRGRQVIAVARTADMVLMMLDATKGEKQK